MSVLSERDEAPFREAEVSFQLLLVVNEIVIPPVEVLKVVGSESVSVAIFPIAETDVGLVPTPASGLLIVHAVVSVVAVSASLQ